MTVITELAFFKERSINRILFLLIIICFNSISFNSLGQTCETLRKFNRNSSPIISKKDFDDLVDKSVTLLETKTLEAISDKQHINIMMCLNTIFVSGFEKGRYEKLELISRIKEYTKKITNRYPNWTPNRGMGFFFPKLQMELGGTPSLYAVFKVKK